MPSKFLVSSGNLILDTMLYVPAASYPTLAASAIGTSTITIQGILPLDMISWSVQNMPAHLALENIYVSAANTAVFTWSTDGTGISAGTVPVIMELVRFDGANLGISAIPQALV